MRISKAIFLLQNAFIDNESTHNVKSTIITLKSSSPTAPIAMKNALPIDKNVIKIANKIAPYQPPSVLSSSDHPPVSEMVRSPAVITPVQNRTTERKSSILPLPIPVARRVSSVIQTSINAVTTAVRTSIFSRMLLPISLFIFLLNEQIIYL